MNQHVHPTMAGILAAHSAALRPASLSRFQERDEHESDYSGLEVTITVEEVPLRLYRGGPVVALIDGTVTLEGCRHGDYRVAAVTMRDAETGVDVPLNRTNTGSPTDLVHEALCLAADQAADERFQAAS